MQLLLVAIGGALGALARFGVNGLLFPIFESKFPFGTFIVNILGSFLIGIFYVLIVEKGLLPPEMRNLVMIGFLGAFTTFSTFSLDTLALWQNGHMALALLYASASFVLCLLATFLAISATRTFS